MNLDLRKKFQRSRHHVPSPPHPFSMRPTCAIDFPQSHNCAIIRVELFYISKVVGPFLQLCLFGLCKRKLTFACMMSACDSSLSEPLHPSFPAGKGKESNRTQTLIKTLNLQVHPEGGYFAETDRDELRVPNPFEVKRMEEGQDSTRSASTTIYYLITPKT